MKPLYFKVIDSISQFEENATLSIDGNGKVATNVEGEIPSKLMKKLLAIESDCKEFVNPVIKFELESSAIQETEMDEFMCSVLAQINNRTGEAQSAK